MEDWRGPNVPALKLSGHSGEAEQLPTGKPKVAWLKSWTVRRGHSSCQLFWKDALREIFRAYSEHGICLIH